MSKYIKQNRRDRQDIIPYLHAYQNCKTCDKCIANEKLPHFNCTWCEMFRDIFSDVREKMYNYMREIM